MSTKNRIIKAKTSPAKTLIPSKRPDKKPSEILEIPQSSYKTPEKHSSPLRVLNKPDESKSEILAEILKRRNMLEETLLKIHKSYSMQEVQLFEKIGNEDEVKMLIAVRPAVLNNLDRQSRARKMEEEKKALGSMQGRHRRLVSRGSNDFSEKSGSVQSSSRSSRNKEEFSAIAEGQIRENLQKVYKNYEEILLQNLESTFQSTLEENRLIIEDYWATVIGKLENKLASLSVVTEESDQEPEKLEYIEDLAEEIEERVRKEYRSRSRYSKGILKRERENNILKFQAELEIEQINILESEKIRWNNKDLVDVQNECKERLWLEHEDILLRKETELRRQAELELQEIIANLVKGTESAVSSKAKVIMKEKESQRSEFEEICKAESIQELALEEADMLRNQLIPVLSKSVYKELKENFYAQMEIDLKLKNEERVKREMNLGFLEAFENYRQRLEKENVNKMIELECQIETNRSEVVKKGFEERFVKVEKELKIGYLRKVDKMKNLMRKEFEDCYCCEFKKLKNQVIKEKCEAGQIKAQINVTLSQVSAEKQAFLIERNSREEQVSRMSRDASVRKLRDLEQSQIKSSPEFSVSPLKCSSLFQVDPEISQILPRPLQPPTLNQSVTESRVLSVSPQRKLLKHYNTKEIVNDIIMKNHEHLNSQPRICRVLETPVRPKSTIPFIPDTYSTEKSIQIKETPIKKSLYAELLHKKYGILEPRYKIK